MAVVLAELLIRRTARAHGPGAVVRSRCQSLYDRDETSFVEASERVESLCLSERCGIIGPVSMG